MMPRRILINPWHSRLIVVLKVLLPMVMIILLAAMHLWIRHEADTILIDDMSLPYHEMVNGRFYGTTQAGQPLIIWFKTATQSMAESTIIDLVEPHADFIQTTGQWVTITAQRGHYHQDIGKLVLYEDIHVIRADSTELQTDHAEIDIHEGTVFGNQSIQGQTTHNEIDAQGFYISDFGNKIVFFHTPTFWRTQR